MNISNEELKQEEQYLQLTIKNIRGKISELGQELYDKEEKVQEFQKFIWDARHDMDPTEMRVMRSSNDLEVALVMRKAKYYQKLFKTQGNPYFGSITWDEDSKESKIYIGITHVEDEEKNIYLVHDWRAPICSLFYDYEVGPAEYKAPEGIIEGLLTNKRQFKITNGELKRVFDNSLNIDDDLLQEVLANESSDKMKNIVNTIQQEQNAIIRNLEDKTLIVQGIAGSGKTSVALHRIAFLLYKIENLSSNNVLIFSPNQIFTEYISNVLPELGEDNTMQTTFNDFLNIHLPEFKEVESFTSFIERYYKYQETNRNLVKYKQSDEIIEHINSYVKDILKRVKFISGIDGKHEYNISKEQLNDLLKDRYDKLLLLDRIEEIAQKICRDYFDGKKTRINTIRSQLNKALNMKLDFKEILKDFYKSEVFLTNYHGSITENEINSMTNKRTIRYEDACIMVYIKGLLEGFDYRGVIKEVIIDEAQDYNKLQYIIIKNIFKKSGFTILGDVNQTINPYYKYESLKELENVLKDRTKYLELSKTYRSTPEIIEHTNKILGLEHVSAIRKENNIPIKFREELNLKEQLVNDINALRKSSDSIALITKTDDEAEKLYELLNKDIEEISILSATTKVFNKKLIIIPSYVAKGLEFDATIIYTTKENKYKEDEKYLYYVACTRSQHQLIIYNQ